MNSMIMFFYFLLVMPGAAFVALASALDMPGTTINGSFFFGASAAFYLVWIISLVLAIRKRNPFVIAVAAVLSLLVFAMIYAAAINALHPVRPIP